MESKKAVVDEKEFFVPAPTSINIPDKKDVPQPKFSATSYKSALSAATVLFVAALIANGLALSPEAVKLGLFKNTTSNVSNLFYTQITPAGWTFAIWSVIYVAQVAWLGYGWIYALQASTTDHPPLATNSLVLYSCVNACNIVWIFLWGQDLPQYSFPVIFILELLLYASITSESKYLFSLEQSYGLRYNLNVARYLILNCLSVYAAWITVANLINLDIVLSYYGPLTATSGGSLSLILLGADVLMYFILENTWLSNFGQYVYAVYPTFAWALSGVVYAHFDQRGGDLNELVASVLLIVSIVLAVSKVTGAFRSN